jgi:hypothetical protein
MMTSNLPARGVLPAQNGLPTDAPTLWQSGAVRAASTAGPASLLRFPLPSKMVRPHRRVKAPAMGRDDRKGPRGAAGGWAHAYQKRLSVGGESGGCERFGWGQNRERGRTVRWASIRQTPCARHWDVPRGVPRRGRRRPVVPRSYRATATTIALPISGYRRRGGAPSVRPDFIPARSEPCAWAVNGPRGRAPVEGYGGGARLVRRSS